MEEEYLRKIIANFRFSKDTNSFKCTASVLSETDGSKNYFVEILIEKDKIEEYSCHCAYYHANGRSICKHIIGVLFYIETHNYYHKRPKGLPKPKNETDEEVKKRVIDSTLGFDRVNKEIECQICLEILKKPVMMPCYMHSVCSYCCKKLLKINKKKQNNVIFCPTCSKSSGVIEVEDIKDLKANKELERVIDAYKVERDMWYSDKVSMMKRIEGKEAKENKEVKEESEVKTETHNEYSMKNAKELSEIIKKCKEIKKQKKLEIREKKKSDIKIPKKRGRKRKFEAFFQNKDDQLLADLEKLLKKEKTEKSEN